IPPAVAYDPDAAGQCIQEVIQAHRACVPQSAAATPACAKVLPNPEPLGANCKSNADCGGVPGTDVGCSGTCVSEPDDPARDPVQLCYICTQDVAGCESRDF